MKAHWQHALSLFQLYWRIGAAFAGVLSYLLLSGGSTFLGFFLALWALLPLFVGLWKWGEEGFFIAGATALMMLFLTHSALDVAAYALFYVLPSFCLGRLVLPLEVKHKSAFKGGERRRGGWLGLTVEIKLLYFLIVMGACCTLFFFWIFSGNIQAILQLPFMKAFLSEIQDEQVKERVLSLVSYVPAFWGLMWGIIFGVNVFLSRLLIQIFEGKESFVLNRLNWQIPTWQYWVLALVFLGCLAENFSPEIALLSRNLIPFTLIPFIVEGMLITHGCLKYFMKLKRGTGLLLSGLVFLGWPLFIVMMVGIFEPWSHLRERLRMHHEGEN